MKIRLAILMSDDEYLTRFSGALLLQYADQVELSAFTQPQKAIEAIKCERLDIVLLEEEFDNILSALPRRVQAVLFVDKSDIGTLRGYPAICKYQKVSDIYRSIASIYAEQMDAEAVTWKGSATGKKIVTFFPGAGGVGASTAAAAFSCRLAERGERVLYLNLEQTGTAEQYFQGGGENDFGQVMYALQMAGASAAVRVENALRRSDSGVYFYSACACALDMLEMSAVTIRTLFDTLGGLMTFDWIVTDMDFQLGEISNEQIGRSHYTVFVSDGSATANGKLMRILQALEEVSGQQDNLPLERISIMYNRFNSRTGQKLQQKIVRELGGIGRVENAQTEELLRLLAQNEVFDVLIG